MTAIEEFLVDDCGLTPTEAEELVEKRTAIVKHSREFLYFPHYIASQIVRAEKENWPLERCF